jgi:hypothetical protein
MTDHQRVQSGFRFGRWSLVVGVSLVAVAVATWTVATTGATASVDPATSGSDTEVVSADAAGGSPAPAADPANGAADTTRDSTDPPSPDAVHQEGQRAEVVIPDDWPSSLDALIGRYLLYWEAYGAAFAPPRVDPEHASLRSLSTEQNWADVEALLARFAADDLVLVRVRSDADHHRVRLPHDVALTGAEGDEVVLQDCWFDEFRPMSANRSATESAPVAASAPAAPTLLNVVMKVEAGQWRVHGIRRATAASAGYGQCQELELGASS